MRTKVLDEKTVFSHIPPKRDDLHKGSAGKVFLVAGSRSFQGAAVMAAAAALRCGCGFVTLASVGAVCEAAARHLLTPTYVPLPETPQGQIGEAAAGRVLELAAGYDVLLVGCGLGLGEETRSLVARLVGAWGKALVLDADGLNAAAGRIEMLGEAPGRLILTPHEGEMARLAQASVEAVHGSRAQTAQRLAAQCGATVVLKGPRTLIAAPPGRAGEPGLLLENPTGNSGLAKAGSGDLLAGMIASLAAQGMEPVWAAAAGVYLHGAAADLTAQRLTKYCMQPTDLLEDLPRVFLRGGR